MGFLLASKHVNHSINPQNKIKTLLGLFKWEIQLFIYFLIYLFLFII